MVDAATASCRTLQPPALEPQLARWNRIARALVLGTMAYNVIEALVAVGAGIAAGSVALVGFGLDSTIEVAAAAALLWRLRIQARGAPAARVERAEARVQRIVAGTFLALALVVLAEAAGSLAAREGPRASTLGLAIAILSVVLMPAVSIGKLHAARILESPALRAEAKETLACSYLSLTLLLGLVAHRTLGWWWADAAAALLMVPWLAYEGVAGLRRGKGCACAGEGLADLLAPEGTEGRMRPTSCCDGSKNVTPRGKGPPPETRPPSGAALLGEPQGARRRTSSQSPRI